MSTTQVQLGQALSRVDGRAKVTGGAKYAVDFALPDCVHGVMVTSAISKGKITAIDLTQAKSAPGVIEIITAENIDRAKLAGDRKPLKKVGDTVVFIGQPIVVVVADTLERAHYAASRVKVEYTKETPVASIDDPNAEKTDNNARGGPKRGDPDSAMSGASVKIESTFNTPIQIHHPMELGGSTAAWNGDKLTVYEGTQVVLGSRKNIADYFGLPTENVVIVSPFVGGGFGARLRVWPHTHLAAVASRIIGKPVKIVISRQQMATSFGHRPLSRQQITLGASSDGKLAAIKQQTQSSTGAEGGFNEPVTNHSLVLYGHSASEMLAKSVKLNIGAPAPMRAPGAPLGLFALEIAIDELAEKCGVDPLEFRLKNDAAKDPASGRPWTDRNFAECLKRGAEKIGWSNRAKSPGEKRDGKWQIGIGVGCCAWHGGNSEATARVRVLRDGSISVAAAAQDMGVGTYTVMAQAAAEVLSVPIEKVTVELGMSTLPPAPGAGGSRQCSSIVPAVHKAATSAKEKLIELAIKDGAPLAGVAKDQVQFANGKLTGPSGQVQLRDGAISAEGTSIDIGALVASTGESNVEVTEKYTPDGKQGFTAMNFGAHFIEVGVHSITGEVRVRRVASVFDCGRIFNRKTAFNQLLGGVTWGIGMALTESAHVDSQARVTGADFGGYHVPSHADVPDIYIDVIDKPDENFGALGSRGGVGELSISGVAAAISNAIYNATGKRLRDCPFTPEKSIM